MATLAERNQLVNVLMSVGYQAAQLPNEEVTGFLSMTGDLYQNELMVVGRAPNGWHYGILPIQLATPDGANAYAEDVYQRAIVKDGNPMQWVAESWSNENGEYNTARSAFWRVIHRTVDELGIADINAQEWPSHLVWSNLYKIAPAIGGNPRNFLKITQFEDCLMLLNLELEIYTPKRVLFLTGWDWAVGFLSMRPNLQVDLGGLVEATGYLELNGGQQSKFVVAQHPQCKPEDAWVHEVFQAFNN